MSNLIFLVGVSLILGLILSSIEFQPTTFQDGGWNYSPRPVWSK